MRAAWSTLALALTGCLALVHHDGPWPCESDADCPEGQYCQSNKCQSSTSVPSGDGGASSGTYCCVNLITGHCGCVTPQIGCQTSSDGVTSSCACQELYGQKDGGVTNTCSIPLIPWTICCLSTLAGYCNCYANGHTCNATLESAVQSCTAAATGVAGTGCQVSNGYCSCDQVSSGDSLCPSALLPVCCQGPYQCRCDYGATCAASEQKVPSCSATALQPLKQCSSEEMLVASCH